MTASRRARFTSCFVALTGGLMIFGGVVVALGVPFWWVLAGAVLLAAWLAAAVTS